MPAIGELKIMCGSAMPELTSAICDHLGCRQSMVDIKTFSDGEIRVRVEEPIRGADVFVIQSTCPPVNLRFMELCLMLDALRRASAGRITAVVPYYGYSRQDSKVMPRSSIGAKLVADFLQNAGIDRLLTVDLHSGQIQGFFSVPVDNLFAAPVIVPYLRNLGSDLVTVSPDASGVQRARQLAGRLGGTPLAIIDHRRDEGTTAIIGSVRDKTAIVIDDMIDTGTRMVTAAEALREAGAREVYACATHPVLSNDAVARLAASSLAEVIVTDTIPLSDTARACNKIRVISVASLLAKAIHNTHTESSISMLFD